MKSLLFVGLLLVLYGTAVSGIREYFYSSQLINWSTAENYCRVNHGHLAHITTEVELGKALVSQSSSYWLGLAWIGLYRTVAHVNNWHWPNGEKTNFTKWGYNEPDDQGIGEDCVVIGTHAWYDTSCGKNFPSICSRSFTLVKEKKTWQEALHHCRTHYTDLAFVNTVEHNGYFRTLFKMETQTDSVWTGLYFLDGNWLWVNRVPMGSLVSLLQCPIHPNRCGAYNFNRYIWENRGCNEKFNFVCYY